MPIIIDGYNLLCSCGFVGQSVGPGSLERARGLFLGWLVNVLSPEECNETTVVFDSVLRLPELPDRYQQDGIEICFATGHQDADEMIIEQIEANGSPRLLIVSSDHQIQRAAKRRKCPFEDSDRWFEQTLASKANDAAVQKSSQELKTELALRRKSNQEPLDDSETQKWLAQFLPGAVKPASQQQETQHLPPTESQDPRSSVTTTSQPTSAKNRETAKSSNFSTTTFEALSKIPRDLNPKVKTPAPKDTPASKESESDSIADGQPFEKVDLSSIESEPGEFPDLNLGQTLAESELKNSMLVPDDVDQWLDDFDSQFEKAKLDIPSDIPPNSNKKKPTLQVSDREAPDELASVEPPNAATSGVDSDRKVTKPNDQPPKVRHSKSKEEVPSRQEAQEADGALDEQSRDSTEQNLNIDSRQMDRWNRQLKETDAEIFPPGYAEDILFAETFEKDERLKRKRRQ